jgi:hypothetical protein
MQIKCDSENHPKLDSRLYDRAAGEGTMAKVARGSAKYIGVTEKLSQVQMELK